MSHKQPSHTGKDSRKNTNTAALMQILRRELLALSFHAFEQCISSILQSVGYENVHIQRDGKEGRNRDGGWDIEATLSRGLTPVKTIVQVKQYETTPVQKRYVDELRGSMLRAEAHQGILITLSTFSDTAKKAAAQGKIAPVCLINGDELVRLMIAHGVGVTQGTGSPTQIDRGFFERLHSATPGNHHQSAGNSPAPVTVVIRIGRPPFSDWTENK